MTLAIVDLDDPSVMIPLTRRKGAHPRTQLGRFTPEQWERAPWHAKRRWLDGATALRYELERSIVGLLDVELELTTALKRAPLDEAELIDAAETQAAATRILQQLGGPDPQGPDRRAEMMRNVYQHLRDAADARCAS